MAGTTKMKATKPSKVVKPQKKSRRTTETTRHHRFQGFSERIARLKIDPIRRRRDAEARDELPEETATYFGRSLEEWRDLNLSATFTAFTKDVAPYCDSLPVVLHNEDRIMDLLVTYIGKADALAMEPLMNLTSHFAHDLDARFEKHFARAVATITSVAARHPDPGVVEWSFTCLAWLFKYLSRLLAPDLRPLYDLMSPYLGKEVQKPFIIRFAAESLSFLVRKAAASYERDTRPLDRIVGHMLKDCAEAKSHRSSDLHQQGVMTLLTEAIKGVQNGIHSAGLPTVQSLLKSAVQSHDQETSRRIVVGVVTSIIHHTNFGSFAPVADVVVAHVQAHTDGEMSRIRLNSDLLFTIASVRKGTRIADWKPLVTTTLTLIEKCGQQDDLDDAAKSSVLSTLAVIFQLATIDAVLPALHVLETVRKDPWTTHFLRFCEFSARLGMDRFRQFILPQFQKFVVEQWQRHGEELYQVLPRLAIRVSDLMVTCPPAMQDELSEDLQKLLGHVGDQTQEDTYASANALLLALPHLKLSDQTQSKLQSAALQILQRAIEQVSHDDSIDEKFCAFAFGTCLEVLLSSPTVPADLLPLWPGLCKASEHFKARQIYWSNVLRYLEVCKPTDVDSGSPVDIMETSIIDALSMPSHQIRQSSLEVMRSLYDLRGQSTPEAVAAAVAIESTPVSMESSRSISLNIRRLIPGYAAAASDEWLRQAIPAYCFGMLHLQLAQAWDDAASVLGEICQSADGENAVIALAQTWLDGAPETKEESESPATILDVDSDGFRVVSDFECSNMGKLSAISKQVFDEAAAGYPTAEQQFRKIHEAAAPVTQTSRSQAIRVLSKMPQIAEKRSRMLVPVLLRWAGDVDATEDAATTSGQRWSRKDQKAMLAVFAQFTNPRVLYRSSEVYSALLNLCANGDVEIQTSALKAIFAWKDKAINRYESHLVNLLDEARFREEISIFLQDDTTEEDSVRPEDHASLMPVLLRLIYGRAVAGGKHGQGSRRKAVFVALSRFGQEVLGMFVNIAMQSVCKNGEDDASQIESNAQPEAPARQQLGMLNMLSDLLATLGSELEPFASRILRATLMCTVAASRRLNHTSDSDALEDASLLRSVRSAGLGCIVEIYEVMPESTSADNAAVILRELIQPRLSNFAVENTQAVSVMLRLLAAWASSPKMAHFLNEAEVLVLSHVAELLREPNAKDEVQLFVLQNVADKLLQETISGDVLEPYISDFVESIGLLLRQQPSKDVLDASIHTLAQLAGRITDPKEAVELITVCSGLLVKPNRIVSPRSKTGLLRTILPLLDRTSLTVEESLYEAVSGLFSRLTQPDAREILAEVLSKLCKTDDKLSASANICGDLNAKSERLDEPNHERRERGFTAIYDDWKVFSVRQWLPIVHNCLFYMRDADDLVNRTSAVQALERFVDAAREDEVQFKPLVSQILLPGIERGMQESSELIRAEFLRLLGSLVDRLSGWPNVKDMSCLTIGGDDEASVFTNILHIQQHRRLRALRRLADDAEQLNSGHITKIWLPLLEHFVFDAAEGDAGRTLADQTVITIGALAKSLNWSSFRATFKRYIGYISTKEDIEKTVLRLLGALVDALASTSAPAAEIQAQRLEIITRDFLPPLMEYLHQKDESTVDRRMPVAVTVVKLLLVLPEAEVGTRLAAILTDVCHVLRSRSQEARDQTRRTLATILGLLGPSYLGFIVKELRSSLQRGYQLHVLSFTVHSLLVLITEACQPGDLNHCLPELVAVVMDDTFGITGQEKDAEEYKSGMKEVKSSKSFDTMELLARVTPVKQLGVLVRPLRALLSEKLELKMIKKADELLIRLRKGVDQNPAADSRDMLIFCHEMVRQVYAEQNAPASKGIAQDYKVRKYLIQMEAANKNKSRAATTSQMYKLISFALNLVRRVVRRHEDLQTSANMAGFLPMTGDALVQGQEEVKIAAMKLLATMIKLPMVELEANAPVYVKEAVGVIKAAPSMTSESAKAALELVTAVLREKRSVVVKEADIAQILKTLKADIDEPDRQGIIYKFLRSLLGRKIVITEVYELMDEVGKVMVTNPDRHVRESARSAYVQFVLDYPQGKDRWNKQAGFLVENLRYKTAAGRQSVMEMLHQLLTKLSDEVLAQLAFTFFVALVPVQVSDADPACRQMAGLLIAKLFERVEGEQLKSFLDLMDKWLNNHSKPMIQIAALQCWSTYLRTKNVPKKQAGALRSKIASLLESEDVAVGPQLLQAMLDTFTVLVEMVPETAFAKDSAAIWENLQQCLTASAVEIQERAATLIGTYFSHMASSSSKLEGGIGAVPLTGSGGLELDADGMRRLCRTSLGSLMASTLEAPEGLISQIVRNLAFLGRCFAASDMPIRDTEDDSSADEDEIQEEEDAKVQTRGSSALAYLLNRLSYIIRADKMSTTARTAALQCQAALVNQVDDLPNLQSLLRPLYTLTDPSIPQPPGDAHRNLSDKARELLDLLQKKVGTEVYVAALAETRKDVRAKRDERRQKRKIEAVAAPERVAKEKRRKHELARQRKKVVSSEARGRRRGW